MGWNSFDSFDCGITEEEFKEQCRALAERFRAAGYEYAVIDGNWQNEGGKVTPPAPGHTQREHLGQVAPLPTDSHLDNFGRVVPAPSRFPSSAGGAGFKPLADFVHGLGLKFGVHIMRGIPRLAVERDLPIKGTELSARAVADRNSTCVWSTDMYGVDVSKPGGQAYYDSLFELYAEWGVDFVKADDMAVPYHEREIEAVHRAREKCGRDIVLSISPGGHTDTGRAPHFKAHCEMWRVCPDIWDQWGRSTLWLLILAGRWAEHQGPGHWADADMLPLGKLARKDGAARDNRMSEDEQRTHMTLATMMRSPLIMGCDLTALDDFTYDLHTNPEVLEVNQAAIATRELRRQGDRIIWVADLPGVRRAVAMFNTGDESVAHADVTLHELGLREPVIVRDLWAREDSGRVDDVLRLTAEPHACRLVSLRRG